MILTNHLIEKSFTMRRSFKPAVENLDSIISLSAMGHKPVVHHKPPVAHVHHSTVQAPPHQVQTNSWTGTLVSGYVVVERVNAVTPNGTVATLSGTGSLNVDRQPNAVRFAMQLNGDQTGTLVTTRLDGSQITASVLTLADGSAGGYQITSATGSWSQVSGTGIFRVDSQSDGSVNVTFNAHQKQ